MKLNNILLAGIIWLPILFSHGPVKLDYLSLTPINNGTQITIEAHTEPNTIICVYIGDRGEHNLSLSTCLTTDSDSGVVTQTINVEFPIMGDISDANIVTIDLDAANSRWFTERAISYVDPEFSWRNNSMQVVVLPELTTPIGDGIIFNNFPKQ